MMQLLSLKPVTLNAWLAAGDTALVDVREPSEYAREHIAGAQLMPLSQLDARALPSAKRIVLCCASGCRSKTAARRLGCNGLAHLEGGIGAWIEAGLPIVRMPPSQPSAAPSVRARAQFA